MHPPLGPQLIHDSIDSWVSCLSHFPFLKDFLIFEPWDLAANRVALNKMKVFDCVAFAIEEFSPKKLTEKGFRGLGAFSTTFFNELM
jgi:hypothetical protein